MYISTLGLVGLQNTISKHFGKPMKIEQRFTIASQNYEYIVYRENTIRTSGIRFTTGRCLILSYASEVVGPGTQVGP